MRLENDSCMDKRLILGGFLVFALCLYLCYNSYASSNSINILNIEKSEENIGFDAQKGNYIVLKKGESFAKQISKHTNTIFEVRDVFDLKKSIVTIPQGCILLFRGGALTNGIIIGTGTIIEAPNYQIFYETCEVSGSFNNLSFYADWFGGIQKAINLATNNSGFVQLSAKVYELDSTLELHKGVTLEGCGNEGAFLQNKGTIIKYSGNSPVVRLSGTNDDPVKNVTIRNLKIQGNGKNYHPGTNVGLYIGPKAYYCKFENISLYACSNGVEIDNGWNLNFESVNPYYCDKGYYLNGKSGSPLTTTVFTTCAVYNSNIGFDLSYDMNATTIVSCGTDGCAISMKLAGCFGVSILSYEFEKHTKYGIHIDDNDCYVTFVGLSPRALGDTSATHIKIDKVGGVTFTDMYISNAVTPRNGYTVDVRRQSAPKVIFNNCVIRGKANNLKECRFIGITQ